MDQRLEIAKRLAARVFASKSVEEKAIIEDGKYKPPTIEERRMRTLEIIDEPENVNLYTMLAEREYNTFAHINSIAPSLTKLTKLKSVTIKKLVLSLRDILKVSHCYC